MTHPRRMYVSVLSTASTSLLKRFSSRPVGVVSKWAMGSRSTAASSAACSTDAARSTDADISTAAAITDAAAHTPITTTQCPSTNLT